MLEYGISGAAVARSWGDKVASWLSINFASSYYSILSNYTISLVNVGINYDIHMNFLGGLLLLLISFLLLLGVETSKSIVNIFTVLKVLTVGFIIVGGFILYDSNNIATLAPYGGQGILSGATACFFGFIGYDEVSHLICLFQFYYA